MNILQKAKETFDQTDLMECPITVFCLNINQLAEIQKEHGTQAADSIVSRFLSTLNSIARDDDLIGYFEESDGKKIFTLMLMGLDANRVDVVIKRFKEAIQKNLLVLQAAYSVDMGYCSTNTDRKNYQFEDMLDTALDLLLSPKDSPSQSKLDWTEYDSAAA